MITISTLLILLYSYSIYKIRKDSGSWKDFDPSDSNIFASLVFFFGTAAIAVGVLYLISYAVNNNIVP